MNHKRGGQVTRIERQVRLMIRAQGIGALVAMPFLLWAGWRLLQVLM